MATDDFAREIRTRVGLDTQGLLELSVSYEVEDAHSPLPFRAAPHSPLQPLAAPHSPLPPRCDARLSRRVLHCLTHTPTAPYNTPVLARAVLTLHYVTLRYVTLRYVTVRPKARYAPNAAPVTCHTRCGVDRALDRHEISQGSGTHGGLARSCSSSNKSTPGQTS